MKKIDYIKDLESLKIYEMWNCVEVIDSYRVRKRDFKKVFEIIKKRFPTSVLFLSRTKFSLKMEWAAHNFLYKLGISESRTKDVDFDYKLSCKDKFLYNVLGIFSWIFIG